jgi:hypothetical protein
MDDSGANLDLFKRSPNAIVDEYYRIPLANKMAFNMV